MPRPSPPLPYHLIVFVLFCGVLLLILLYFFESNETASYSARTLEVDGYCCFQEESRSMSLKRLPSEYEFLDYEYIIHSAVLSTFHRDVTSSQVLYGCKHPVYTLIVYEYGGELLSICPASERTWPFVWTRIVNINGQPNTCVLFNSEILHAGRANKCKPRLTRQYKICHRDDIKKLGHLQGVRATKNIECVDDYWSQVKRKISYYFAFPINHLLYPFLMKNWGADTWMGQMQSLLPDHQFYNNV